MKFAAKAWAGLMVGKLGTREKGKGASRRAILALLLVTFTLPLVTYCSGRGNVDLSKATPLTAEPVELPKPTPKGPNNPIYDNNVPLSPLFSLQPGQWVDSQKAGGTIDPVGTTLNEDFDGDGITNDKETNTNIWVADYPVIETEIAPPVTMQVEVLKTSTQESSTINSDITSDELENRKNEGSEKFHQNELNEKTVQYEKEVSQSSSSSSSSASSTASSTSSSTSSASASASTGGSDIFGKATVSAEFQSSSTSNSENKNEHNFNSTSQQASSVKTSVFEDRPFKNNLDRTGQSVKSDAAAKNARQYRKEKSAKAVNQFQTTPNGGQIRAALFIKNFSTNMPVRISNILCSLLFETPQGVLIPVQSFRLRNDDFSLFEVEVYGGSEFGPYVVTLNNLNTVEIENALAQGYMPKIYVVDYQMTHVADSNYRAALSSSFTGNNLKIVEENAKGRTALIKVFGPNMRRMYRVTAFDVQRNNMADDEACTLATTYATNPAKAPGLSLRRALQRISCDGLPVEFEHYILDFTGTELEPIRPMVYMYGIKSINGFRATAPCSGYMQGTLNIPSTVTGDPGSKLTTTTTTVNACKIRVADLTEDQIFSLGLWTVFDNGKYYKSNKYLPNAASPAVQPENRIYLYTGTSVESCGQVGQPCAVPIIAGVESKIWAGDNYDIVYMKLSDILNRVKAQIIVYGTNPLETGAALTFNTLWDKKSVGPNPFYPNVKSTFLGQAGLTDRIELEFKVNNTKFLNPSVGSANTTIPAKATYADFNYNYSVASRENTTQLFNIDEAIDFEINPGLGGTAGDWTNLRDITVAADAAVGSQWGNCGKSWDFIKQTFKICIMVPRVLPGVDEDSLVTLYLRPTLSNATRNAIWPEPVTQIKRFQAQLIEFAKAGDTQVQAYLGTGTLATDGSEANVAINAGDEATNIAASGAVAIDDRLFVVELNTNLTAGIAAATAVTSVQGVSFTGTVKLPANSGEKIVRIIPTSGATPALPLGALLSGKLITIGGTDYTIQVVRQYNKVYTISLQYALTADHTAGEKVFVKPATIPNPQVQYSLETGFLGAWNTAPTLPYGSLRADTSTSCPSPFSPVNCYGYLINQISTNWLGFRSFTNDWADASQLITFNADGTYSSPFATTTLTNLFELLSQEAVPKSFALGKVPTATFTVGNDVQVNGTAGGVTFAGLQADVSSGYKATVVSSGNKSLVVYRGVGGNPSSPILDVRGRLVDLTTGLVVGSEIQISTTAGATTTAAVVYNGVALVAWSTCNSTDGPSIQARRIDITTGNAIGSQFTFATIGWCNAFSPSSGDSVSRPSLAVDGNGNAVLTWVHTLGNVSGSGIHQVWSAIYSMTTSQIVVAQKRISDPAAFSDFQSLGIFGNTAVIAYSTYDTTQNGAGNVFRFVFVTFMNTTTGSQVFGSTDFESPPLYVDISSITKTRLPPHIAVDSTSGRALLTWDESDSSGPTQFQNHKIGGRIIDVASRMLIDSSNFYIDSLGVHQQALVAGNKAIVLSFNYEAPYTACDLSAIIFDIGGLNPSTKSKITIAQRPAQDCRSDGFVTQLSGSQVLVTYAKYDGLNDHLHGQRLDLATAQLVGSSFNLGGATDQQIAATPVTQGDKVLITWVDGEVGLSSGMFGYDYYATKVMATVRHISDPTASVVYTYPTTLPYGPNTFFTAPLIERNYTVTSKIKF